MFLVLISANRTKVNKQYMSKIPAEFMQKKETSYGISVCKIILTNIK